jgi:hypothetical protein
MPLASDKSADNRNTFRPRSPESSVSPPISLPPTQPDLSNLLKYSPESAVSVEAAGQISGKVPM